MGGCLNFKKRGPVLENGPGSEQKIGAYLTRQVTEGQSGQIAWGHKGGLWTGNRK